MYGLDLFIRSFFLTERSILMHLLTTLILLHKTLERQLGVIDFGGHLVYTPPLTNKESEALTVQMTYPMLHRWLLAGCHLFPVSS